MPACVGDGVAIDAPAEVVVLDAAVLEEVLTADGEVIVEGFVVVLAVPAAATQI
jgi:hypothetical protein